MIDNDTKKVKRKIRGKENNLDGRGKVEIFIDFFGNYALQYSIMDKMINNSQRPLTPGRRQPCPATGLGGALLVPVLSAPSRGERLRGSL
jgi:hypothetical protein